MKNAHHLTRLSMGLLTAALTLKLATAAHDLPRALGALDDVLDLLCQIEPLLRPGAPPPLATP